MFNKIICFNYHWHNFSEMHYLISFNFQHFFREENFFFCGGCNILAIYCYIVHFLISIIYMFSYLLISFSLSPLPILLRNICNMLILISI